MDQARIEKRESHKRRVILGIAIVAILVAAILTLQHEFYATASTAATPASPSAEQHPGQALKELAAMVEKCMTSSRPVLLGSRNPQGPSCVAISRSGDIQDAMPIQLGDVNGGPGTTMGALYFFDRNNCKSAQQDFAWHQNRLRTFLENETVLNRPVLELASRLAEKAQQFHEVAENWSSWPAELSAVEFDRREDWPGYCMAELDKAVAAKNLSGVKHWAGELASATFALADLHRWMGFLTDNYLRALDFQQQCRTLFPLVDARQTAYDFHSTISQLPAGILCSDCKTNYYEIERQAERLFSMPPDRAREISMNQHLTPGSLWMLPGLREQYRKLQDILSPENQKTWDTAARTPFEHSYMTNMLYRAWQTETVDDLEVVLKKFDALHPHASVGELMSVLMYRGHSFAGLEWGDRYQPQLREAADQIPASMTDTEALLNACRWTHEFYNSPENYGPTFTLRDALQKRKLDCVRATDMMGAIYRNAGRTRFGNVRWCGEASGIPSPPIWASRTARRKRCWPTASCLRRIWKSGRTATSAITTGRPAWKAIRTPTAWNSTFADSTATFGPKAISFAAPMPVGSRPSISLISPLTARRTRGKPSRDRIPSKIQIVVQASRLPFHSRRDACTTN
jgi:hypothetical protein